MPARSRPLSPHLSVYRWQIGSALSILHRVTGALLALGLLAFTYWLVCLAGGPAAYERALRVLSSPFGVLAMIGWTFAFFFHLLNGVRHLFWDAGYGYERNDRRASGWMALGGGAVLTVCVWFLWWHFARV